MFLEKLVARSNETLASHRLSEGPDAQHVLGSQPGLQEVGTGVPDFGQLGGVGGVGQGQAAYLKEASP